MSSSESDGEMEFLKQQIASRKAPSRSRRTSVTGTTATVSLHLKEFMERRARDGEAKSRADARAAEAAFIAVQLKQEAVRRDDIQQIEAAYNMTEVPNYHRSMPAPKPAIGEFANKFNGLNSISSFAVRDACNQVLSGSRAPNISEFIRAASSLSTRESWIELLLLFAELIPRNGKMWTTDPILCSFIGVILRVSLDAHLNVSEYVRQALEALLSFTANGFPLSDLASLFFKSDIVENRSQRVFLLTLFPLTKKGGYIMQIVAFKSIKLFANNHNKVLKPIALAVSVIERMIEQRMNKEEFPSDASDIILLTGSVLGGDYSICTEPSSYEKLLKVWMELKNALGNREDSFQAMRDALAVNLLTFRMVN